MSICPDQAPEAWSSPLFLHVLPCAADDNFSFSQGQEVKANGWEMRRCLVTQVPLSSLI